MSQNITLAIVVTNDETAVPADAVPGTVTDILVINATEGPINGDRVVDGVAGANVKIVDISPRFDAIVEQFKHEYISFVDEIPTSVADNLLTERACSPLRPWVVIVDRFKSTSTEYDHPFNVLCRAAAVGDVVADRKPDYGWVTMDEQTTVETYESVLARENVKILSHSARSPPLLLRFTLVFLYGLLAIGLELVKATVATVIDALWPRSTGAADEYAAVLFSRSRNWHQYDWTKDRYYHALPEVLREDTGMTPIYAVQVQNDDISRTFWHLARKRRTGEPIELLQGRLGPADFVEIGRTYLNWSRRLYKTVSAIDTPRRMHGVNVMPIVRAELLAALPSFPFAISLFEGMHAYLGDIEAAVVTTTHFESTSGRTVVHAARHGARSTPTVGIQHGPITDGKLQYLLGDGTGSKSHPHPDRIAVDGETAARALAAGGYPTERVRVTGGVRYDPLFESIRKRERRAEGSENGDGPVVVFFGLSDFQTMAEIVIPALSGSAHDVALKPHPSAHIETAAVIERLAADHALTNYEIVGTDAHDLIARSQFVIASYSSTAIEALAFSKPLICVPPKNRLDPTPFDGKLVPKVQTETELRRQLDNRPVSNRELDQFLDAFFYVRDGSAAANLSRLCGQLAKRPYEVE